MHVLHWIVLSSWCLFMQISSTIIKWTQMYHCPFHHDNLFSSSVAEAMLTFLVPIINLMATSIGAEDIKVTANLYCILHFFFGGWGGRVVKRVHTKVYSCGSKVEYQNHFCIWQSASPSLTRPPLKPLHWALGTDLYIAKQAIMAYCQHVCKHASAQ